MVMHEPSLDRVGNILARTEETFSQIEEQADKYAHTTAEYARLVEEWATTIIEQDNQFSSLFVTKVDEITGTFNYSSSVVYSKKSVMQIPRTRL